MTATTSQGAYLGAGWNLVWKQGRVLRGPLTTVSKNAREEAPR